MSNFKESVTDLFFKYEEKINPFILWLKLNADAIKNNTNLYVDSLGVHYVEAMKLPRCPEVNYGNMYKFNLWLQQQGFSRIAIKFYPDIISTKSQNYLVQLLESYGTSDNMPLNIKKIFEKTQSDYLPYSLCYVGFTIVNNKAMSCQGLETPLKIFDYISENQDLT